MSDTAWGGVGGGSAEEQSGLIDNTPIGSITPSTGAFTSLTCQQFSMPSLAAGYVKVDGSGLFISAADVPVADVSGIVPVSKGGTGLDSYDVGDILYCTASNILGTLGVGANGQVLTLAGGVPTWATITGTGTVTSIDISGGTTGLTFSGGPITTAGTFTMAGTLSYSNGGTGVTSAPANGQLLIGNGTGYTLATLTAGSNVTINNAAGAITISSSGGGGATGAFVENDQVVASNYTITAGKNAHSVGPITINTGVDVTIPTGSIWQIS